MKLTICELSDLNELITSCVNTITCMSLFKNQVTNEELKSLLCTHFPIHVEDYNRKVEFVKNADTATGNLILLFFQKILNNLNFAKLLL